MSTAQLIMRKLEIVARDPYAAKGVKKLSGRNEYRLRVGDWRALYLLDGKRVLVLVTNIGPRGGNYK